MDKNSEKRSKLENWTAKELSDYIKENNIELTTNSGKNGKTIKKDMIIAVKNFMENKGINVETNGYSTSQIRWLTKIEKRENICIQHALKPGGEINILGVGKVDGYCKENNTIYEYDGAYYHGDPTYFMGCDKPHKTNDKTFEDLHNATTSKHEKIKTLGYNLVVKKEKLKGHTQQELQAYFLESTKSKYQKSRRERKNEESLSRGYCRCGRKDEEGSAGCRSFPMCSANESWTTEIKPDTHHYIEGRNIYMIYYGDEDTCGRARVL